VDGLVDAEGEVLVASIFSSGRRHLNGCPVVYADGALIHHDTPLFDELGAYARKVLRAVGLRRSPFQMEVVRDARGPCLVEVGARLVGHSHAFTCQRVHGGAFDFFGLAAAGYFGKPMDLRLSFEHYDRVQAVKVYGASEVEGTAYEVRGVEEVEALPSYGEKIAPEAGQECFARPALISGEDKKGEQQVASDPHRRGALAEGEERPEEIARRLVVRAEELPRRVGQSAHRR
jgi:hypothetical protein